MASERIIVGYDGSDHARDGLALARLIAGVRKCRVTLAAVLQTRGKYAPIGAGDSERTLLDEAEWLLDQARASFGEDVRVETRTLSGSPARELHQLAESTGADLIVLGAPRDGEPGHERAGTVGEALLHGSPAAVVVAARGLADLQDPALRTIGVAVDGSSETPHVVKAATRLAKAAGAKLRVITVVEDEPEDADASYRQFVEREREHAQRLLDEIVAGLPKRVRGEGVMLTGDPGEALADASRRELDLLVLGSRSYGPAGRVMLGGVPSRLTASAPTSVLVVPRAGAPG